MVVELCVWCNLPHKAACKLEGRAAAVRARPGFRVMSSPTMQHTFWLTLCSRAQGVSHRHLSDHLSDLVESTLADLERSKVCTGCLISRY